MGLPRTLGILVVLLSIVSFAAGVVNITLTCTWIVFQCIVTPLADVPTFLYLTYTGVALWASIMNAVTGLYATNEIKEEKREITRLATLTFLSCFVFSPAMIAISTAEAYYFQALFPVQDYTLDVTNPYLLKFSADVAIAGLGLVVFIPLFVLFAFVYCCPAKLSKNKKSTTNKKKETSSSKDNQ